MQLEQLRQTGKVVTKEVENKGKRSVTKLKMGQPDDEQPMMPATPPPMMMEGEMVEDDMVEESVDVGMEENNSL